MHRKPDSDSVLQLEYLESFKGEAEACWAGTLPPSCPGSKGKGLRVCFVLTP